MTVSVLQWNILYEEDISDIAQSINRLKPDIFCVQELTHGFDKKYSDTGQELAKRTKAIGYYQYGSMRLPTGEQTEMGNGIFSRFPIVDQRCIILQPPVVNHGQIIQDARLYLETVVRINKKLLTVGTTHLPFRPTMRTTNQKKAEVKALIAHVDSLKTDYILTGDLNATPDSIVVAMLRRHLRLAGPPLGHKTWTLKPFKLGNFHANQLNWRFDYIFYKGQLKVVDATLPPVNYSDHRPILVTFEF